MLTVGFVLYSLHRQPIPISYNASKGSNSPLALVELQLLMPKVHWSQWTEAVSKREKMLFKCEILAIFKPGPELSPMSLELGFHP